MKSTVEQHNVPHRRKVTVKDVRLVPVIGRHCQSSLKRLEHAYRDCRPAAVLVSRSRFAPGYVVDSFLATIDKEETVILIAQALDDPTAFMDEVVRGIGFECKDLNLSNLEDIAGLFLRYQKVHQRRTVLVVRDIDAHGAEVRAAIRKLIEKEVANEFGLMVILTGPASDSPDPQDPKLDDVLQRAAVRIVLTPFAMAETREFIRDRFVQSGSNGHSNDDVRPSFDFYAVGLIHELSSGVPETVDLLCRKSIELAAHNDETAISTTTVKAVAQLLGLMPSTPVEEPEPPVLTPDDSDEPAGQLIVKVGGEAEKRIRLNGSNLLIGRDKLCDICLQDVQVSRLHGLFARAADGVYYLDLGSTNGSAVNGETTRRMVLENKDVIAVGDVRIIYAEKDVEEADGVDLDATDTFEIPEQEEFSSINYVGKGVLNRDKS
ncbi:MAG: FHA domain-containing protein [Gammaproteobacteria bacterium]|jgi:type II secretory pathway predicted ATPase ExeA|nr:FHA domain-containing protein [Gammaproteobacteria bacterium]